MDTGEIFGKNAERRRKDLGLTQDELKNRLGAKSRSAVTMFTSDFHSPNLETVFKWAKALECSPADLISEESKPIERTADSERLAIISLIISLDKEELSGVLAMLEELSSLEKPKFSAK